MSLMVADWLIWVSTFNSLQCCDSVGWSSSDSKAPAIIIFKGFHLEKVEKEDQGATGISMVHLKNDHWLGYGNSAIKCIVNSVRSQCKFRMQIFGNSAIILWSIYNSCKPTNFLLLFLKLTKQLLFIMNLVSKVNALKPCNVIYITTVFNPKTAVDAFVFTM